MRILKEETYAVIIDIQEKLYPHMSEKEKLLANTSTLIKGLKILNIPIIVTQQYTKGLGPTIQPLNDALGQYLAIEKVAFSCCDEPLFMNDQILEGKKWVIIAGIESHICVLQTVIDLIANGYIPVIIEDCVSSREEDNKRIAVKRMRSEGAIVTSYESVLFELCRYAGTDAFKSISKLVK